MKGLPGLLRCSAHSACLTAAALVAFASLLPAQQQPFSVTEAGPQAASKQSTASQGAIPDLPELDWDSFGDVARKALEPAYERAKSNPKAPAAVGLLGMTLHAFRKFDAAAVCYRRAAALAPGIFRWPYGLAIVEEALYHHDEATAAVRATLNLRPDFAPAHTLLGDLLLATGDNEAAEKAYEAALQADPKLPTAHLGLGRLRERQENWEGAISSYERASQLAGDFATAHYALGLAYRKVGKTEQAEASLRRYQVLRKRPVPVFDPFLEAVASLRESSSPAGFSGRNFTPEQKQQFVSELEEALAANPQLVWAHSNLIALYWQAGQLQKAEDHYRKAIEIDANSAAAHYNWGRIEFARGNMDAAAAAFEKALAGDPHHADALVQSGLLLERKGQAEEAEQRYRRALETNPIHRQAHYLLARSLMRGGDYAGAIEHLEETIQPEDAATPRYMRALASTYAQAGNPQKAIETLRDARSRAVALNLGDLAAAIDGDLARLGAAPVTQ